MMRKRMKQVVLAVGIFAYLGQNSAKAIDFVDGRKAQYGFTNWVGITETNYSCLVTNWAPNVAAFGTTNEVDTYDITLTNGVRNADYCFVTSDRTGVVVHIQIYERQGVSNAHNAMMEYFGSCQIGTPFPLGTTNTVRVGDRCYTSYLDNSNVCDHVFFVRNNMFLAVRADDENYSVKDIAVTLDNELKAISTGQ